MRKYFLLFIPFIFLSCATNLSKSVERPAELDLNGATSISVLPFQICDSPVIFNSSNESNFLQKGKVSRGERFLNFLESIVNSEIEESEANKEQKKIVNHLTDFLSARLLDSNYFSVISPEKIKKELELDKKLSADVYLTGRIKSYESKINKNEWIETVKNKDGTENHVRKADYKKEINIKIIYEVISSENENIISSSEKAISKKTDAYSDLDKIEKDFDLVKSDIESFARQILREVKPYYETLSVKLIKSKKFKSEVKSASELAENGYYDESKKRFLDLYNLSHDFAAGYNAAQLMLYQGDLDSAKTLMEDLTKTGESQARKSLEQINKEIFYAEKLQKQRKDRGEFIDAK